ncbi:MAG: HEAT repeat domain-containing protein [Planctomycetota bacterium]|jgi:HEAT repeat protein
MKRKSRLLLSVGALLGAVATGLLIVYLLGDDEDAYRRGMSRDDTAEANAANSTRGRGPRAVQTVTEDDLRRREAERLGGRFPTMIKPGRREAFDSPETEAERKRQSLRVLEILQKIRENDTADQGKNQALYLELQKIVRRLGHRLPQQTRSELVGMIDTVDPKWRRLIGATLGNLRGDVETAQVLMAKLEGRPKDRYTRDALLIALTNMEVKEVLPSLTKMLGDGHDREDLLARAIGRIGGREATDTLLAYLEKPAINPTTAREIERILGAGGDPKVLKKVEASLASKSVEKRVSMLHVLGAARKPEHAGAIRDLLASDSDPRVQQAAVKALGHIGDPASGKLLLELAQSSDKALSNQAITAIHSIRSPKTIGVLVQNWSRLDDKARFAVMGAGSRLPRPTPEIVQVAVDSVDDPNERIRNYAVGVLGQSRDDAHVETLGAYLRGAKTARERGRALWALGRIGSGKAAEEVLQSIGSLPPRQQDSVRMKFEALRDKHEKLHAKPGAR